MDGEEQPQPLPQSQGSGEEQHVSPPLEAPQFPAQVRAQQGAPQALTQPIPNLVRPPPGGLTRSPEELTRQIGWKAMAEAVTTSATQLYPQDPKAAALTVANTLQPYLHFLGGPSSTPGTGVPNTNTPLSKTTESIVLGALTGKPSHEVAKYQHTFPNFPGDRCRDDVDLLEEYLELIYGF